MLLANMRNAPMLPLQACIREFALSLTAWLLTTPRAAGQIAKSDFSDRDIVTFLVNVECLEGEHHVLPHGLASGYVPQSTVTAGMHSDGMCACAILVNVLMNPVQRTARCETSSLT